MGNRIRDSRFLSLVLRHKPETIGLTLDSEGWARIDDLVRLAKPKRGLTEDLIREIVRDCEKQRYSLRTDHKGTYIRANQGHSISVNLRLDPRSPPPILYHGTATRFLDSIQREGLKPGTRNHVHLSHKKSTAAAVGRRHGELVLLEVRAREMWHKGHEFFRSDNGVWLTVHVPYEYITPQG